MSLAFAATGFQPASQNVRTSKETAPKIIEQLVHVQTSDGITNGGAMFAPAVTSASPIAVIWIGPSRVDTVMIQNADHMYRGEEAQVAQTIANWAIRLVPRSATN